MDGILLFNKPILWTSHDVVDCVRWRIGQRRVGHAGTLDPLATGLLVVLVGAATRLASVLSALDKDYVGVMTFGFETDTQDLEGKILREFELPPLADSQIQSAFDRLTGFIEQEPPAFSAVRKDGKKLYHWTRQGVSVQVKPRTIEIKRFSLLEYAPPDARFFLTCSKGTYVRSLCETAGRTLGVGGVLSALVRARIGPYALKDAVDEKVFSALSPGEIDRRLIRVR